MSKILIIEDNQEIRENMEELLQLSDYEVITAANGQDGLQSIQQFAPDIILCDVAMPRMDGYQVLEKAKSNPETTRIPFIFVSASAQQKDIEEGKMAGVDAYLTKPFSSQTLFSTIEKLLGKYG